MNDFKHGHPKFYELLDELKELYAKKNKQYADPDNPMGNFFRGSDLSSKLLSDIVRNDKYKRAMSYALMLATKQIDGVFEILSQDKKDTPDSLHEKLRDVIVYFAIIDVLLSESESESTKHEIILSVPDISYYEKYGSYRPKTQGFVGIDQTTVDEVYNNKK